MHTDILGCLCVAKEGRNWILSRLVAIKELPTSGTYKGVSASFLLLQYLSHPFASLRNIRLEVILHGIRMYAELFRQVYNISTLQQGFFS